MADRRGRREILQTLADSELIKCYRLDHAGIMFVVDINVVGVLISSVSTSYKCIYI